MRAYASMILRLYILVWKARTQMCIRVCAYMCTCNKVYVYVCSVYFSSSCTGVCTCSQLLFSTYARGSASMRKEVHFYNVCIAIINCWYLFLKKMQCWIQLGEKRALKTHDHHFSQTKPLLIAIIDFKHKHICWIMRLRMQLGEQGWSHISIFSSNTSLYAKP